MKYLLKLLSIMCVCVSMQCPSFAAEKASRDDAVAFVKKGVEF